MNHISMLIIALRVAALYLIVSIISNVPEEFAKAQALMSVMEEDTIVMSIVLPSLIKALVAVLFWFFPNFVIRTTVPDSPYNSVPPGYFSNLNIALISAVGVYLASYGVSDLVYYVTLQHEMAKLFQQEFSPQDKAGYVATIAQVTIGVLLIIGNKGVSKFIKKIRQ